MHIENLKAGDSVIVVGPKAENWNESLQSQRSYAIAASLHAEPLLIQAIQPPFLRVTNTDGRVMFLDWRDVEFVKATPEYAGDGVLQYSPHDSLDDFFPGSLTWNLRKVGIQYVGDLHGWSSEDLLKIDGVGPTIVQRLSMLAIAAGLEMR